MAGIPIFTLARSAGTVVGADNRQPAGETGLRGFREKYMATKEKERSQKLQKGTSVRTVLPQKVVIAAHKR